MNTENQKQIENTSVKHKNQLAELKTKKHSRENLEIVQNKYVSVNNALINLFRL